MENLLYLIIFGLIAVFIYFHNFSQNSKKRFPKRDEGFPKYKNPPPPPPPKKINKEKHLKLNVNITYSDSWERFPEEKEQMMKMIMEFVKELEGVFNEKINSSNK